MITLFEDEDNKTTKESINLDSENQIVIYRNIDLFKLSKISFQELWNTHPEDFHEVLMHGKLVKTPRWQQAYGKNYEYTGSKNNALPLTVIHKRYIEWCKDNIDERINGLLINWYSGEKEHYIGKHRDSIKGLQRGSPIITISHGGERVFRFRPYQKSGYKDFKVSNGDVIVIPWDTNRYYTHEVPHLKRFTEDRISVTLRAYE